MSPVLTLLNIAAILAAPHPERRMKEALKLFGTMAAIIVSVSVLHGFSAQPDSLFACQPELCNLGAGNDTCSCVSCTEVPFLTGIGECK